MKYQVAWNWKASRTELVVSAQKREQFVLAEAEWLRMRPSPHLIPVSFNYAKAYARHAAVSYNIMGTTKLSKVIKRREYTFEQLMPVFSGMRDAIAACLKSSMLVDKILFKPDYVYLDADLNPKFVFVPFSGMQFDPQMNSPFTLIDALTAPRRFLCATAEGERRRDALHHYVLEDKAFSVNEFGKLLEQMLDDKDNANSWSDPPTYAREEQEAANPVFIGDLFADYDSSTPADSAFALLRVDTGESLELRNGVTAVLGSSRPSDIVVRNNEFMAPEHVSITVDHASVVVSDCDTPSGTYAFNRRLAPYTPIRLYEGDRFLIGGEEFLVVKQGNSHVAK